ncbi:hypothetical protein CAOG_00915 [Capsaspora owczarzaki ATCC 30864]|uniref:hypothetical protein n=1 Tax=Capsaspora owczarzaki (strain ATCC 30864) TaxID=595528 RepID=UPI0003523509|nr:hypothetical protein CAOG_00915 [Capsaspora owczarzaki ATCC 30864]|eukprot:XP_004365786.2 hypothetical protein CAOG_00915 [Capsaspora owczarzaki ATCC 30864]
MRISVLLALLALLVAAVSAESQSPPPPVSDAADPSSSGTTGTEESEYVSWMADRERGERGHSLSEPKYANLHDRKLLTPALTTPDIMFNHDRVADDSPKTFTQDTLGYVTPWNSRGYEVATRFRHKLTYISPVWYQIRKGGESGKKLQLVGGHNVDKAWLDGLRTPHPNFLDYPPPRIVPRFMFEEMSGQSVIQLLSSTTSSNAVAKAIVAEIKKRNYDGLVIDFASMGFRKFSPYPPVYNFLELLSSMLKPLGKVLVLTAMPRRGSASDFDFEELQKLSPFVDKFQLMTYDFSSADRPGPNAPMPWLHSTLERVMPENQTLELQNKIFLGVNFYGNDYCDDEKGDFHASSLLADEYLKILELHEPMLEWEEELAEHVLNYMDKRGRHIVFYPTVFSLFRRLQLAHKQSIGVAFWELGQGLDFFFDMV